MRRLLYIIVCLTCSMLARAQSTYQYRYWFDDDFGNAMTTTGDSFLKADFVLTGLSESIHTLHLQVVDEKGVASNPQTRYFIKAPVSGKSLLRYWFDDNVSSVKTVPVKSIVHVDADVLGLSETIHRINMQVVDENGVASLSVTKYFIKTSVSAESKLKYWFDDDSDTGGEIKGNSVVANIDVSMLTDGLHKLRTMVVGNTPSAVHNTYFLKTPQILGVNSLQCVSYIDGKLYKQENVPADGSLLHYDLDASGVSTGLHLLTVQIITNTGAASSTSSSWFLRTNTMAELSSMKCFYSVDGEEGMTQAGKFADGTFHFDLDVASVSNGLHRLSYLLVTEDGQTTAMRTAFFMKTPLGGNGIAAYHYWLNSDYEGRKQVNLEKNVNPLTLMSLLPVESVPLRSSQFHFEWKDGKPMIYAQNDFHIRFYDAADRCVDQCKDYTDYSVSREITDAELLVSGSPVVKDKPAENEIQWYHFPAAVGDSLSFKVDRACTVQVFAPSGKEVYNASGSDVVRWDGCHAWEDGEYYLALHDVTAQQGTNTKLDYQHIDKYAILAYDVHRVGNGGMSTITFNGNGFKNLYAVDLINGNTTVKHIDIGYESDATTTVSFDFEDAPLGQYKAVFHFVDEDRTIDNMLEVEEQKDLNLIATISYPSTFLRGSSTTYTVNITNTGNSTAYVVPIELKLMVNSIKNIQHLKFSGDIKTLAEPDFSLIEGLEQEDIDDVIEIFKEASDLSQFVIFHDSISEKDYGMSQLTINVAPYSTAKFSVTIKSSDVVNLYAYTSAEWFPLCKADQQGQARALKVKSRSARESMCCMKDRFECGASLIANVAGYFMPPGASCLTSLSVTGLETAYDVWCTEGNGAGEKWRNYLENKGHSLASRLIQSAVSCITNYYKVLEKSLRKDYNLANSIGNKTEANRIYGEILAARTAKKGIIRNLYNGLTWSILGGDCIKAFTQTLPNCPPNPKPGGGGSTPVNSLDPNDITGYTAESGSHFVKKDLVDVNYKIEFENDTAFATASAHTVVIKDTLDSKLFDLASFAPTSVKIGEKMVELDGTPNFVKTIDMRPEIYAIAQVEGSLDKQKGIATWTFTSLDPMTMEPTDDVMSGFLPVNYDGRGQGEVTFDIKLRSGLADGTEIPNRASIVFDNEEAIMTPTWVNTIDAVAPVSRVVSVAKTDAKTATVYIEGADEHSGIWHYDLYVQYGEGTSWVLLAENVDTTAVDVEVFDGVDYGFCVLATDSAGNVEQKELYREAVLGNYIIGDANTDGVVDLQDAVLIAQYFIETPDTYLNFNAADFNFDGVVDLQDAVGIVNKYVTTDTNKKSVRKRINIKH